MRRRNFIILLPVVAGWSFCARARQQPSMQISASNERHSLNRSSSMPENGLVSVQSRSAAPETIDKLLSALANRNLTVFARVDHATGAASVGLQLRPTELVAFSFAQCNSGGTGRRLGRCPRLGLQIASAATGGLMSYGHDPAEAWGQVCGIRRQNPQRRAYRRSSGRTGDQGRIRAQPQDHVAAWYRHPVATPGARIW